MKIVHAFAAFVLLFAWSDRGRSAEARSSCEGTVVASGSVLGFSGCISAAVAEVFVDAADRRPELAVIESSGGDVSAAIRMAMAISRNQLKLVVRGGCFSSCANYILPASPIVIVERNAFVGFHGDVRLTIDRMSEVDRNRVPLLDSHRQILEEELQFAGSHPRATWTHDLQSIALAPVGVKVSLVRSGNVVSCLGRGYMPWLPTLDLLLQLKLIDRVEDRDEKLLPDLPGIDFSELRSVQKSESDPTKSCNRPLVP